MKLNWLIFLFVASSCALVFFALEHSAKELNDKRLELIRNSKIQKVCKKDYLRKRKIYVPTRSFIFAQKEINRILEKQPLVFSLNSFSIDVNSTGLMKNTLIQLLAVVKNTREDVILSIETHTDDTGSKQHNLELSQKRADVLKNYFLERVDIPLIVAIGYGEELPLSHKDILKIKNRRVEINLKRIQQ